MIESLNAINKNVDAANLTLRNFAASKNKIVNKNGDILLVVGDLENHLNIISKNNLKSTGMLSFYMLRQYK